MKWLTRQGSSIPNQSQKDASVQKQLSLNTVVSTNGANTASLPASSAEGQLFTSTTSGTAAKGVTIPNGNSLIYGRPPGGIWSDSTNNSKPSAPNIMPNGIVNPQPSGGGGGFKTVPYPSGAGWWGLWGGRMTWSIKAKDGSMLTMAVIDQGPNATVPDMSRQYCTIAVTSYLPAPTYQTGALLHHEEIVLASELESCREYLAAGIAQKVDAYLETAPLDQVGKWTFRFYLEKQDRRAFVGLLPYLTYGASPVARHSALLTRLIRKLGLAQPS